MNRFRVFQVTFLKNRLIPFIFRVFRDSGVFAAQLAGRGLDGLSPSSHSPSSAFFTRDFKNKHGKPGKHGWETTPPGKKAERTRKQIRCLGPKNRSSACVSSACGFVAFGDWLKHRIAV